MITLDFSKCKWQNLLLKTFLECIYFLLRQLLSFPFLASLSTLPERFPWPYSYVYRMLWPFPTIFCCFSMRSVLRCLPWLILSKGKKVQRWKFIIVVCERAFLLTLCLKIRSLIKYYTLELINIFHKFKQKGKIILFYKNQKLYGHETNLFRLNFTFYLRIESSFTVSWHRKRRLSISLVTLLSIQVDHETFNLWQNFFTDCWNVIVNHSNSHSSVMDRLSIIFNSIWYNLCHCIKRTRLKLINGHRSRYFSFKSGYFTSTDNSPTQP